MNLRGGREGQNLADRLGIVQRALSAVACDVVIDKVCQRPTVRGAEPQQSSTGPSPSASPATSERLLQLA